MEGQLVARRLAEHMNPRRRVKFLQFAPSGKIAAAAEGRGPLFCQV